MESTEQIVLKMGLQSILLDSTTLAVQMLNKWLMRVIFIWCPGNWRLRICHLKLWCLKFWSSTIWLSKLWSAKSIQDLELSLMENSNDKEVLNTKIKLTKLCFTKNHQVFHFSLFSSEAFFTFYFLQWLCFLSKKKLWKKR